MPINIYTIKHPLILNWTNHLIHQTNSYHDTQELVNKISLALIYEVCRKKISSKTLYIKYIHQIHKIWLTDHRKISLLCPNLHILQAISKDARILFPTIRIHGLILTEHNNNWHINPLNISQPTLQETHNIIILENELKTNRIKAILEYIYNHHGGKPQIQICCNNCTTKELDNLGQDYSTLDIYTGYIAEAIH